MRKTAGIIFTVTMLILSLIVTYCAVNGWENSSDGFYESAEKSFANNFPFSSELSSFVTGIRYQTGARYFDGIYIGEDGSLLRDIGSLSTRTVATAKNYINMVSEKNRSTYFCLIPTAAVIRQQEIADYAAENLQNQRHMINDMYSSLYGSVNTIDVYQILFSKRNEYIYYHTEDMPTCLGGYYIYSEIADRIGVKDNTISSFSAYYTAHGFYGSLAKEEIKKYAHSDFISLYEYNDPDNEYMVTHIDSDGNVSEFPDIFIYDESLYEDKTDMILGGITAVTIIESNQSFGNSLLVFCDESAKSWLPFMASCYDSITVIDLSKATAEQLSEIRADSFSDILFAYSTKDFADGVDFAKLDNLG